MTKYILLSIMFTVMVVQGQNYKEDLLEVSKKFGAQKTYSMILNYQLFIDRQLNKPYEERKIEVKKSNGSMLIKQSNGIEILDNRKFQILVNSNTKLMSAIQKEPEEYQQEENLIHDILKMNLDSMPDIFQNVKVLSQKNNMVTYEFIYKPNEQVEKMILTINKTKRMYDQIIIQYKKPIKINELDKKTHVVTLKISYNNYTTSCVFNAMEFSETKYLQVDKQGNLLLSKKYSGYQFLKPY